MGTERIIGVGRKRAAAVHRTSYTWVVALPTTRAFVGFAFVVMPPLPVGVRHKCPLCSRTFLTSGAVSRHRQALHKSVPYFLGATGVASGPPTSLPVPPSLARIVRRSGLAAAPLTRADSLTSIGRLPGAPNCPAGTPITLPVFSLGAGPASVSPLVWSPVQRSRADGSLPSSLPASRSLADRSAARLDIRVLGRTALDDSPSPTPLRHIVGILPARILAYYRSKGDAERTRSVVRGADSMRPTPFTTAPLRKFRLFALTVGHRGLTSDGKKGLWDVVVASERATAAAAGTAALGPMETAFETAAQFVASFSGEENRWLAEEGWWQTTIIIDDQSFEFYSRDLWAVAVDAIVSASQRALFGERKVPGDGSIIRSGTLDSDLYLEEQAKVFALYERRSKVPVFMLATQLFSDAAVVSWSGGVSPRATWEDALGDVHWPWAAAVHLSCCWSSMEWGTDASVAETDSLLMLSLSWDSSLLLSPLFVDFSTIHLPYSSSFPKRADRKDGLDDGGLRACRASTPRSRHQREGACAGSPLPAAAAMHCGVDRQLCRGQRQRTRPAARRKGLPSCTPHHPLRGRHARAAAPAGVAHQPVLPAVLALHGWQGRVWRVHRDHEALRARDFNPAAGGGAIV